MMRIDPKKKIIVDADVLFHFIKGNQLGLLPTIFFNKLYIIKDVFDEVFKGSFRVQIENMIRYKFLLELSFSTDINIYREYARLKKTFGKGESACMAY